MRRETKARRAHRLAVEPIREQFRMEHPGCMMIGCKNRATDIHEICRGVFRKDSLGEPAVLLSLCRTCHDLVQRLRLATQLWIKRQVDPENFSLEAVRRIVRGKNGREARVIEESDVDEAGKEFKGE